MEEKYKIIPLGIDIPYTIEDLSVVIPHASWYKNRLVWFLERYFKGTPDEVIKNTILVCDPNDEYSFELARKYEIKAIPNKEGNRDYSTLKLQVGFEAVKTRLCARIHNDALIRRDDWAERLIEQFNFTDNPQLIGQWQNSGDVGLEDLDRLVEMFFWFKLIRDKVDFYTTDQGVKRVGTEYFHAYFMASQTYIFRDIYPQLIQYNNEKMDKEDCLFSLLASSYNVKMVNWANIDQFIKCVGGKSGDFEAGDNITTEIPEITGGNIEKYPKPIWNILNERSGL